MPSQAQRSTLLVMLAVVIGCNSDGPLPPTAPTPPPGGNSTRVITLAGDLAFGTVPINTTADRTVTIRNSGNSSLTITALTGPSGYSPSWTNGTIAAGASHTVTIRFAPAEQRAYDGTLTANGNHSAGLNVIAISGTGGPAGPSTQIGSGQYLVNSQIAPGRYFADPILGCYWERLKGLSGSFDDIIANDFIGSDVGQSVVDILASDLAFESDSDCGTWFNSPRRGFAASVSPGTWLVGTQIAPGVYQSNVSAGCYWERVRDFEGVFASVISNAFVSSPSVRFVDIRSSDVGFSTDTECGTWTLVSSAQALGLDENVSPDEVRKNRELHRASWPSRGGRFR